MPTFHILDPDDRRYPARLRALPDPPPRLWVRGTAPDLPTLALVGTRTPSEAGRRAAAVLTVEAVERGWDTVAGLAAGVDHVVHEATLAAGGRSWAFIGDGVDRPEFCELAHRMCLTGGGVCSEQPPGTTATPDTRRRRDRLQAAVAHAVIVIEAGEGCGTLHTVAAALRLGRPVVVVRHDGLHPAAAGSRALLSGASGAAVSAVDLGDGPAPRWEVIEARVGTRR